MRHVRMIAVLLPGLALLVGGCADYTTYSLAHQCADRLGCVTARPQPRSAHTPGHIDAIRPQDAGTWEPVIRARQPRPKSIKPD
ncbi:MAG: hypothetical protein EBS50_00565 [Sphingomonadaceae bacterium]|jgi:hypothetical protein|nr:hypothetical protein [Sphingomonadaceae bacterium]